MLDLGCRGEQEDGLVARFERGVVERRGPVRPERLDLVGSAGTVVTAIPVDGYGEVLLQLAGQPVKFAAKSPIAVARGTEVWVADILSPTSVEVRTVDR